MKTVTVQIQLDVNENRNILGQVLSSLDTVNNLSLANEIEGQPCIFTSDLSESDIILNDED